VRDPEPAYEARLDAGLLEGRVDLRPAPVHHHGVHTDVLHEGHILREGILQLLVLHRVAAVLDDQQLAREAADVGQGLEQNVGLLDRTHGGLMPRAAQGYNPRSEWRLDERWSLRCRQAGDVPDLRPQAGLQENRGRWRPVERAIGRRGGAEIVGEVRKPRDVTRQFERVPLVDALVRLLGEQNFTLRYGSEGRLRTISLLGEPLAAQTTPADASTPDKPASG